MADVLARGLSGYNTRWFQTLLPDLLAGVDPSSVSCALVFLGLLSVDATCAT